MVEHRIAIIPARGGSKRIPRKNVVDFFGKPLIAWTIEAALESGRFTRVLVSTDDDEIASESVKYGASVPFLRTRFADDHTPVSEATIAALQQAEEHWGESYSTVVQLLPSCPLRDANDIQNALEAFDRSGVPLQVSCFKFGWMNPWWSAKLDAAGKPSRMFPESATARSQDLGDLYCPTGAVWIGRPDILKTERSFYGSGHVFEPISWTSSVDIDEDEDLEMARAVWLMRRHKRMQNA